MLSMLWSMLARHSVNVADIQWAKCHGSVGTHELIRVRLTFIWSTICDERTDFPPGLI